MRQISKIIIHCTDSDSVAHDFDALGTLRRWHVEERGFQDIGYHFVISKSLGLQIARPIRKVGAHARGHNRFSIGIALCGQTSFSNEQFTVLNKHLINLIDIFDLSADDILGHCEINPRKTCPNFSVEEIRGEIHDYYTLRPKV